MTIRTTSRALGAVLAMAALLTSAGCSRDSNASTPTPSTPIPTVTAISTPSASPSPAPSTISERAAVDGVISFLEVLDRLSADPESDLDELNTVATGNALAQWQHNIMRYRVDGWRQIGQQVPEFAGSTPGSSASEWFISMCIDVSDVDVLDASGESVVDPGAPTKIQTDFRVDQQTANNQWYVAEAEATGTC